MLSIARCDAQVDVQVFFLLEGRVIVRSGCLLFVLLVFVDEL